MNSIKSLISTLSLIVAAATVFTGCLPAGYVTGKAHGKAHFDVSESQISGFGHVTDESAVDSRIELELDARVLNTSVTPNEPAFAFPPNAKGTIEVEDQDLEFVFNGYVLWAGVYTEAVNGAGVAAILESATSSLAAAGAFSMVGPMVGPTVENVTAELKKGKGKFNKAFLAYGFGCSGEESKGRLDLDDSADCDSECVNPYVSLTIEAAEDGGVFMDIPLKAGDTLEIFFTDGDCGAYQCVGLSKKAKIKIDVDKKPKKS